MGVFKNPMYLFFNSIVYKQVTSRINRIYFRADGEPLERVMARE